MGLITTITRRSLLGRPGRTLFSILGIAVGIATVVGIFALDHNTVRSASLAGQATWQADIEITPSVEAVDSGAELEGLEGISEVTAAFQHSAHAFAAGAQDPRPQSVHIVAIEAEDAPGLGAYRLIEGGRDIDPNATVSEVLVGRALQESLGLELGGTVELARPRRAAKKKCVEGEWRVVRSAPHVDPPRVPFVVVGVMEREHLGRRANGQVVLVDYQPGLALYEGANVQTRYWAKRDTSVDLEKTEKSLASAYSYELKGSVIVGQAADERAFRNGVRFAGLVAMVLGLFVIFYTLSRSLVERVREIATLHSLGATRGQIGKVFFSEALVISGVGALLGLAGGLLFAYLLQRFGVTTLGRGGGIKGFDVPWVVVLPLAFSGFAIALIGSVYPLLRARALSTVAALRGQDAGERGLERGFQFFAAVLLAGVLPGLYFVVVPVVGEANSELGGVLAMGLGVLALFIGLPLVVPSLLGAVASRLVAPLQRRWPLSGMLAARAMQTGSARVSGAIAGIALVTAGFVGLRAMTNSLQAEIDVWADAAIVDKIYVRGLPNVPFAELADELSGQPGILGVEPCDLRHYVPFLVVGVDPAQLARYGPCATDPELMRQLEDQQGIVLSTRLSDYIEKRVGDSIHLKTGAGDAESLRVVAVSDAYGYSPHPDERLYGVVASTTLLENFCIDDTTAENVAVRLDPQHPDAGEELVEAAVMAFLAQRGLDAPPGGRGPGASGALRAGSQAAGSPPDGSRTGALRESAAVAPASLPELRAGTWYRDYAHEDIEKDFVLFDIILALSGALAALGMLNGQLLAALERQGELGALRALGTDGRQIAGLVLLEALVVGLLGGLLGALLGTVLAPIIVRALTAISGLPLVSVGPGLALPAGLLAALALAFVASLYPLWRMSHADPVAAVRSPG